MAKNCGGGADPHDVTCLLGGRGPIVMQPATPAACEGGQVRGMQLKQWFSLIFAHAKDSSSLHVQSFARAREGERWIRVVERQVEVCPRPATRQMTGAKRERLGDCSADVNVRGNRYGKDFCYIKIKVLLYQITSLATTVPNQLDNQVRQKSGFQGYENQTILLVCTWFSLRQLGRRLFLLCH